MGDTTSGLFVQTTGTSSFVDPTTTKGDMIVRDAAAAVRQPVGPNLQSLLADSAASNGIRYQAMHDESVLWNVGLSVTVAANALTIALKQQDGATDPAVTSPVIAGFRSSTSTSGLYNLRSATAATSLVVPSTATLGTLNGVEGVLYVYLVDSAGTPVLGVSQTYFDPGAVAATTTLISAAATSGNILYTAAAVTTPAVRLIGRIRITEATAGTWATAPTSVAVWPFDLVNPFLLVTSATTGMSTSVATITYPTIVSIREMAYNTSTGVATFWRPGVYAIKASMAPTSATWVAGNAIQLSLRFNGAGSDYIVSRRTGAGIYTEDLAAAFPDLAISATTTVEIRGFSSQSVNLSGSNSDFFSISYVGRS